MALDVSVVVTAHKQSANLGECLRTVSRQEYAPLETLVVEIGAGDDQNHEAARQAGAKYIVGTYATHLAACNAGASEASGEIIAFLDQDCIPEPDWLEALLQPFDTAAVMVVAGGIKRYSGHTDGPRLSDADPNPIPYPTQEADKGSLIEKFERIAGGVNVAFRRSFFDEFGGFDERLTAGGSFAKSERLFRAVSAGHTLVYAPRAVVLHP